MIIDIILIIFIMAGLALGVLIGFRRGIEKSAVSAVCTFIALAAALFLSVATLHNSTVPAIGNFAQSLTTDDEIAEYLNYSQSIADIVIMLVSLFVFPVLLALYFFLFKLILLIPSAIVKAVIKRSEPAGEKTSTNSRCFGMLINGFSALLIVLCLAFPLYSYAGLYDAAFRSEEAVNAAEKIMASWNGVPVYEIDAKQAPLSGVLYRTFSRPCISYATQCDWKDGKVNIYDLGESLEELMTPAADLYCAAADMTEIDVKETSDALTDFVPQVLGNDLLRSFVTDTLSFVSGRLSAGKDALGITREDIVGSGSVEYGESVDAVIETLGTVGDKLSVLDSASEEQLNKEFDDYGVIISDCSDFILSVFDTAGSDEITDMVQRMDAAALGNALETLNQTLVFKGDGSKIIELIFNLDELNTSGFNGRDLIPSLTAALEKGDGSFASTLEAARRAAVIAVELSAEEVDEAVISDQLEWLAVNMDESIADTVKTAVTSSAFASRLSEETAGSMSKALNLLCDRLAVLREMSSEDSAKETAALRTLYNTGMKLSSGNISDGIFGEQFGSAEKTVDTICSSQIISSVITDLVYDEQGNINTKPLGVTVSLNGADEDALITALKDRQGSTDEKLLNSIAVVFGTQY